jgi:hypothetical protein
MAFLHAEERAVARALTDLSLCNPFLPERVALERQVLGRDFADIGDVWHARPGPNHANPNVVSLAERATALADTLRGRLAKGAKLGADTALYDAVVLYALYDRTRPELSRLIQGSAPSTGRIAVFDTLVKDLQHYLAFTDGPRRDPALVLALFFQVRRAFHFTHEYILGASAPAARLRAAVWQAIFTRDMGRYWRALHQRMQDVTTLIVGPSGTGKELVAQAIGRSRFIPFDPATQRFAQDFRQDFYPLNVSALPGPLVESELFGHKRGAFTGAVGDRRGWLELCPPLGTVFLDEVAEITPDIQVKLLRVLQARTFHRVGETGVRHFRGKLVAATNRDLAANMQAGRVRPDFYYRLCADVIETPTLAEQLRDAPDALGELLRALARRIVGEEEADGVAREAEAWIDQHLGRDYAWPGNVRELEQCVRNVMVRGTYRPPRVMARSGPDELTAAIRAGSLSADALLRRYCTLVFASTGSYQETARRLGIDRRTVKDKVDPAWLDRLRSDGHPPARASDDASDGHGA